MAENKEELISLNKASKNLPYSAEYLGLLIRKGKIRGVKKEGKWQISRGEIEKYLKKMAEANYQQQENLNVKIAAVESQKAATNLKWALALAMIVIIFLVIWGMESRKKSDEFILEKDEKNNLIIRADNPDSVGSVTVVPK